MLIRSLLGNRSRKVIPSTYFVTVVFLQSNAEITVLHTVLNVLALKKQPTTYGKEGREEEIWEAIQELREMLSKELIC